MGASRTQVLQREKWEERCRVYLEREIGEGNAKGQTVRRDKEH